MTLEELNKLATFNTERARGIMHTETWVREMMRLQAKFDREAQQGVLIECHYPQFKE